MPKLFKFSVGRFVSFFFLSLRFLLAYLSPESNVQAHPLHEERKRETHAEDAVTPMLLCTTVSLFVQRREREREREREGERGREREREREFALLLNPRVYSTLSFLQFPLCISFKSIRLSTRTIKHCCFFYT